MLHSAGMNINAQDSHQRNTALHIAVGHRNAECTRVLLQLGADTAIVSVRSRGCSLPPWAPHQCFRYSHVLAPHRG